MSEIIDTLTLYPTRAPSFLVDLDAVGGYVAVSPYTPLVPSDAAAFNGSLRRKFHKGDNFIILSAGYRLPESFTVSTGQEEFANIENNLVFSIVDTDNVIYDIPSLGVAAAGVAPVHIPMENYEISIGSFIDVGKCSYEGTYLSKDFYICLSVSNLNISMRTIPAALDGLTFRVYPFIKILHNFPITGE